MKLVNEFRSLIRRLSKSQLISMKNLCKIITRKIIISNNSNNNYKKIIRTINISLNNLTKIKQSNQSGNHRPRITI